MWACGVHNGYGRMIYPNGEFYIGEWRNNIIEGHGIYSFNGGRVCEGKWINGIINGHGREITHDYVYEGMFQDNIKHGEGNFIFHGKG